MSRTTIDVGIDLGTTNSAIAVLQQGLPHVIMDNLGHPLTPSVVRISGNGRTVIGHEAYNYIYADPENTASEFKRWMGTAECKRFAQSGIELSAPELSAKVLGSLKDNVKALLGEDLTAAVITVPAAFDMNQSQATEDAAKQVGIDLAPLLQEPIAASLAYGSRIDMEGNNWLVFDLGGGTFDLALVGVRDGRVHVLDHEGDNFLGGKDLDWVFVEQILLPRLSERFDVRSFHMGNTERRTDLSKLKGEAEKRKIELSRLETVTATIETTHQPMLDDRGVEIEIDIPVTRSEYEAAIEHMVDRTVVLAHQVLARNPGAPVESVLMVGGPTLTPLIRRKVEVGLGVKINTSANPLTVVAEGAALFAATQTLPRRAPSSAPAVVGKVVLDLGYKSVTESESAQVAGRVPDGVASLEFDAQDRSWTSGQLPVTDGRITASVPLRRPGPHTFRILARAANGTLLDAEPESVTISRGLTAAAAPLSRSFGVVVDDGTGLHAVNWLIDKGHPLPARTTKYYYTTIALMPGDASQLLQIHIVEGDNRNTNPTRSHRIGTVSISAQNLWRKLPIGAPVEVTIEITESRLLKASAYISAVDETFVAEIALKPDETVTADLARDITDERERVAALAEYLPIAKARELHERLRAAAADIQATHTPGDEASQRALSNLQAVQIDVDELEASQLEPRTMAQARQEREAATTVVHDHGDAGHQARLRALSAQLDDAIAAKNVPAIRDAGEQLATLRARVLTAQPWWWVRYFRHLADDVQQWTDAAQARALVQRGEMQLERDDVHGVRDTCIGLWELMAPEESTGFDRFQNVGIRGDR